MWLMGEIDVAMVAGTEGGWGGSKRSFKIRKQKQNEKTGSLGMDMAQILFFRSRDTESSRTQF